MSKIRVLLVEDNRLFREGIAALINAQTDMKVVAVSGGDDNTVLKVRTANPHVILVDLSGLRLVASLRKETPELKVIGMGLVPSQSDIVEFVEAGASGFILKDAKIADFLMTVRSVARGETVLPPVLIHSLFSQVVEYGVKKGKAQPNKAVRMTKREREIVALIADGLRNKEIGLRLNIATDTVKSHVHNILEKLALHSRLQISAHLDNEEPLKMS